MKRINLHNLTFLAVLAAVLLIIAPSTTLAGPDPTGSATGNLATIKDTAKAGPITLNELADAVGHNRIAINFVWMLLCGFLVMFMQAGFAAVETGFTRAKNAAHTMGMNFLVYAL